MSEDMRKASVDELLDIVHVRSDDDVKLLICQASLRFRGQVDDLFMAVGCLVVGRLMGWRVLRIALSGREYAKYQRILSLGTDSGEFHFNQWVRDRERLAYKSFGLKLVDAAGDFWAAVKGRLSSLPVARRREIREMD